MDFIFTFEHDSNQRLYNLKSVLSYYRMRFPTNKFILSETGKSITDINSNVSNISHIFEKTIPPHSQSRTINNGLQFSKESVVCIVDCDVVLVDYENIEMAYSLIKNEEFDYIIPYKKWYDLPNFSERIPNSQVDDYPIGGIFLINRNKFLEIGGMDEKYKGWGGEDDERHFRCKTKLKHKRMDGQVFHFPHPEQNEKYEWVKINKQHLDNDISNLDKAQEGSLI